MRLSPLAGALCAALLALTVTAPVARAHGQAHPAQTGDDVLGHSTLEQRLVGPSPGDRFARLRIGPGEPYVVRDELARPRRGRDRRRRSIVYLAQLSDFQIADEESPARVEFTDRDPSRAAKAAWRPQEAVVVHQVETTIRQVNAFLNSPVPQGDGSRARMLHAVLTGDQVDNQQLNETQWVLRLLAGGTVDPSSGTQDLAHPLCPSSGHLVRDFDDPRRYTGVQDYRDYLVPDSTFYDPEDVRGFYAAGGWPAYPGLMDRAQGAFEAEGLKVPSYVAFGNHDALAQGNAWANAGFESIGTGCVKPLTSLGDPEHPLDPLQDPETFLARALVERDKFMLVPRDARRRYVDKREFKQLHATTGQPDAHGFAYVDPREEAASDGAAGYYAFSPRPGLRYVVLDTVSEGGVPEESNEGNIDVPQFQWLERELAASQARDELILVFAHHALETLIANVPDEVAPPCIAEGRDPNPGCDRDPRLSTHDDGRYVGVKLEDDLRKLLHAHPNVIALVAGHSHANHVRPRPAPGPTAGFWEIKSPAVVDWPTQHRLIEVMDNRDGTLSIFGTILDHAGAPSGPAAGDAARFSVSDLASLGRVLAYNDPQVGPGPAGEDEGGEAGRSGTPIDRNVELLIADPRAGRATRPRIRLRVRPRVVRAGRRVRLRFRARAAGEPVAGARIRIRGRSVRTGARGRATLRTRFPRRGVFRARARRADLRPGRATVRAVRRRPTGPRYAG